MSLDWNHVRGDFPILNTHVKGKPLAYLDNAATSQKPKLVLDALNRYWTTTNANIHRGVHTLSQEATAAYDQARARVRDLLGAASTDEIIFTKGCTEAINLAASSWGDQNLQEGDRILVSTMEHHSNIVPWQLIAQRKGAIVEPIEITDDCRINLDSLAALLAKGRVKLVAIAHVSNAVGTIHPVAEIIRMAHDAGALVLVDGAQSGPHQHIDVRDLDADFYTLSCHKMYAPTGVGVLYCKRALLDQMPPYQGGGDMIRQVSFAGTTYADLPAKFEAGTPNIAGVVGLGAAIDYLHTLGDGNLQTAFDHIHQRETTLSRQAACLLGEIPGVKVIGNLKPESGIVSFTIDTVHPHDIGTILDSEGIAVRAGHHCCMPLMRRMGLAATSRASFAFYNTEEEVDRLVAGVRSIKEMFQ